MKRFTGRKEDVYMVLSFYFNPRFPRGSDRLCRVPSARLLAYFNPRSPRWERQRLHGRPTDAQGISIHAPREGSD